MSRMGRRVAHPPNRDRSSGNFWKARPQLGRTPPHPATGTRSRRGDALTAFRSSFVVPIPGILAERIGVARRFDGCGCTW